MPKISCILIEKHLYTRYIKLFIQILGRIEVFQVKKGQASGAGAAILVMLIAVLIVVYILAIPPSQREELLEGEGAGTVSGIENDTLLLATPGRMDYMAQKEIEHPISSVSLYSTTDAQVVKSVSSLYAKNAWFDKKEANVTFSLEDIENTGNVLLSFNVKDPSGSLIIELNGDEVFNSEITRINVDPIKLPEDKLKEHNTLVFKVSGVGFKFWGVNEYNLEKIKITADITDITTREAKQVFLVTSTEKENAEKSTLRFYSDCKPTETGILNVFLNGHNIFSAAPDCGVMRTIEISPTSLVAGKNELHFKTSRGAYVIDSIVLKTDLKEMTYPTYYFDVDKETYGSIQSGLLNVGLAMEFPDDIEQKKADIFINGHAQDLYTTDRIFKLTLSPFINLGNNVIEIKPKTTLEVVNLKVATVG